MCRESSRGMECVLDNVAGGMEYTGQSSRGSG